MPTSQVRPSRRQADSTRPRVDARSPKTVTSRHRAAARPRSRYARPQISPSRGRISAYPRVMARIAPGLPAREWLLAGAFGLYVTVAPFGAVALVAAPTAVDAARVPIYAAIGMLVGVLHASRSRRRATPAGRSTTRALVVAHALALPCALSFAKLHDLGWDDPHLGGVLFVGGSLSVLWRVIVHRRATRHRTAAAKPTLAPPR